MQQAASYRRGPKPRVHRAALLALSLVALLTVSACQAAAPSTPATAQAAPVRDELRIAVAGLGNEALDPVKGPSNNGQYLRFMFDSLVGTDYAGLQLSKETGLAREWAISSDYRTFTFILRQGVKFHNGDEVTADDVQFSLERLKEPGVLTTTGPAIARVLDTVTVKDRYTVAVQLKESRTSFLLTLSPLLDVSGLIVPKKYFQSVGPEGFAKNPIGSGPYKFVERQVGASIMFEQAFPEHFAIGKPRFKRVTLRLVPEESTRLAMLKSGDVDFIDVGFDKTPALKQAGFKIFQQPALDPLVILFQSQRPGEATQDMNVRKALSYAINRQEINEKLLLGQARLGGHPFFGQAGVPARGADPYDSAKAKEFLNQTEYKEGGKKLTIQLQVNPRPVYTSMLTIAEAIQGYWKKISVDSVITYRDFGAMRAEWAAGSLAAPAAVLLNLGGRSDWQSSAQVFYTCSGGLKSACDPELDKRIGSWAAATNQQQVDQAASSTAQFLADNAIVLTLAAMGPFHAGNNNVRDDFSGGYFATTWNERALIWERK